MAVELSVSEVTSWGVLLGTERKVVHYMRVDLLIDYDGETHL